jgi:hypothetical protein
MSTITVGARLEASRAESRAHSVARRRRYWSSLGTAALSALILVWSLAPSYNMVLISLET